MRQALFTDPAHDAGGSELTPEKVRVTARPGFVDVDYFHTAHRPFDALILLRMNDFLLGG